MLIVQIKKQLSHYMLDVRFNVGNEIAVLFGPSGSGKTTILNSIAGLSKINDGQIILNGKKLNENGKSLIPIQKRRIGYLFQDYALFPHKTVWENIAYGMKGEEFTRSLMSQLKISHLAHKYPHEISGGEKQRVAFIRAMATEPELLLLDEPFSALDEQSKRLGYEQLRSIHQLWHIPIIVVSHQMDEMVQLASKIIYIDNGKVMKVKTV